MPNPFPKNEKKSLLQQVIAPVRNLLAHMKALTCQKKFWQRLLPWCALVVGSILAVGGICLLLSVAMCAKEEERILSREELLEIGEFDYVIVLGCKVHDDGRLSARLQDRVDTGIDLFQMGIGETLLMSGDRQPDGSYDEVGAMQAAAIAVGVEGDRITLDPHGYSTYESIEHLAKELEGKRVVIVTQTYHLYRALYIAERMGLEAYGVSADRRTYSDQLKCEVREVLARVKDLWYTQVNQTNVTP